jgi:hypothetical protein
MIVPDGNYLRCDNEGCETTVDDETAALEQDWFVDPTVTPTRHLCPDHKGLVVRIEL